MKASAVWLLLGTLAMGCASATRSATHAVPPPVTSDAASRADTSSGMAVPWSRAWPLSWADFKASAPSGGVEGAHTVYELTYEWQCRGNAFQSVVTAVFLPNRSWVKLSVVMDPSESARVLGHEQTHFNLTELHARRMRKFLAELYSPCSQTEERLRTAVDGYITDEAAAQKRYDDDTRYGLERLRQRMWDREVNEMLTSLDPFASR